jgi:hypothetical protein
MAVISRPETLGGASGPPLVSVIIPAYNSSDFIVDALSSVFAQTFQDFEVIVVNDGSPDTEELDRVLEPYLARITYLQQPNRGPAAARNAGIRRAQGEYVAFLDSDDIWEPEFLASQLSLFESQPGTDLVYANLRLFGDSPRAGRDYMRECPSQGPATFESVLCEKCQIPTTATVARRHALVDAGLFDESLRISEDYDLWLRIARRGGRILYQRRVLARHRLHGESLAADPQTVFETASLVLGKLDREFDLSADQRTLLRHRMAYLDAQAGVIRGRRLLRKGEVVQARECLERARSALGGLKLQLAIWGLRIAPRLAKTGAAVWEWALRAKSRLRRSP